MSRVNVPILLICRVPSGRIRGLGRGNLPERVDDASAKAFLMAPIRHLFASLVMASLASGLVPPQSTVAVIGSTGKLGRCAVRELVAQGYAARCLVRDVSPADVRAELAALPGVTLVEGDVTDRASVESVMAGCSAVLALHGARRTRSLADFVPFVDHTQERAHARRVRSQCTRFETSQ